MSIFERYQNPTKGNTVKLRLFTYNSNNFRDVKNIQKIEIFFLDPNERTASNKDGKRLIQTVDGTSVTKEDTGHYFIEVELIDPLYTIGNYLDIWTIEFEDDECPAQVENIFQIFPYLWFTTPIPVVYDFLFTFRPNRLKKGSKRYIIIEITPNVPRASDLARYYENLAIVSDLKVSIEIACGDCVPQEKDLRLIVDKELVDFREKRFGYYFLDTTELDCGIYNIWFDMELGNNYYISDTNQFQIFE
jgi:hypothetical protein